MIISNKETIFVAEPSLTAKLGLVSVIK